MTSTIAVIGAGPAGIGAAYALRDASPDVVIFEREAQAGGLCRSFTVGSRTFDFGGHAFFTRHQSVSDLLESLAPEPLFAQPRNAWVYSHGSYVPYPFQSNLFGLPVDVVYECLVGAIDRFATSELKPPSNLDEFLEAQFGPGIARHFLLPYNAKLWAHPLTDISINWTNERIVQPDIKDIVAGALSRAGFRDYPNAVVRYPMRGGFMALYRPLIDAVAHQIVHSEVAQVDLSMHSIQTVSGSDHAYDHLVATLPLPDLVARTVQATDEVVAAAAALSYNSLYLVSLVVAGRCQTDMHRVYVADPGIPFHKVVFNDTSSPSLRSAAEVGVQAEVSFSSHKRVNRKQLPSRTIEALVHMGLLHSESDVLDIDIRSVKYAYPIATAAGAQALDKLTRFYAAHDVSLLGRFGEWKYVNSDNALYRGLSVGESLR